MIVLRSFRNGRDARLDLAILEGMLPDAIMADAEVALQLITELDTRISASPLAEAWQVRAAFLAAESLAAVDGTPTRPADILGLMTGTPLPHIGSYLPAAAGFAHWRVCLAKVELSDLASRLIGRTLSRAAAADEQQKDRDLEKTLPLPAQRRMGRGTAEDVDRFAYQVGDQALRRMRERQSRGSRLWALANDMREAVRVDPDPTYFERIYYLQRDFLASSRKAADQVKSALPSPTPDQLEAIDAQIGHFVDAVRWEKKSHLGACFAILPDRIRDLGLSVNRLTCMTGATKRLGFEGRLDDRAYGGFLRRLAQEARTGLALLDSLERSFGHFAGSPEAKPDARSQLPEVIYAFLLYPAVDTLWLQTALDLHERVVRKLVKRLADASLIVHWADKRARESRGREVRLWTAAEFERDFQMAISNRRRLHTPLPSPAATIERYRDAYISKPMSLVFESFDQEMLDIDREFGRFFARAPAKSRPSQSRSQRDSGPL